MAPTKMPKVVAISAFLVAGVTIVYYLAKVNLFFYATGVFWNGAVAGFAGCLFLLSLILNVLTKKRSIMYSMLAISALVTAILWLFKPGDSDVWWYGAIAGFFSCAVLALFTVTAYIAYKLLH